MGKIKDCHSLFQWSFFLCQLCCDINNKQKDNWFSVPLVGSFLFQLEAATLVSQQPVMSMTLCGQLCRISNLLNIYVIRSDVMGHSFNANNRRQRQVHLYEFKDLVTAQPVELHICFPLMSLVNLLHHSKQQGLITYSYGSFLNTPDIGLSVPSMRVMLNTSLFQDLFG